MREGAKYRVHVSGHGEREATFLGRISTTDVHAGDFVGMLFMGGYAYHVVRIGAIEQSGEDVTLTVDWNGMEKRSGGSLLAESVTSSIDGMCREVWRPVADES